MKELNDEIKLTIHTMQTDIDDGAHDELQGHLEGLLELRRERIASTNVVGVRLRNLLHQNPGIHKEE